ncbi:hypothetical protein KAFR_0H02270 [Kazachstania africana CBS 2517]|uniref:Defective in cullin neddylation protein n=1 Tax=Kazachstania africana (strain ATCC 22294 / BCRC 22015 / CBS 2517 / CECT 1963 / NBRC 1671 / NRRL Y-8276) TaxID=1071382 RepID=H2AZ80_KAZAF|nr:hypothetical protein KAFR_0H02270 [Kazachstania africana CBS 2517]CCF59636.1 hypothetical protein KAFR_0H02270 [Kazachstania africana CBS 2517]
MVKSMEEEAIVHFIGFTQCEPAMARKYLSKNRWNINYALNDFYDSELGGFTKEHERSNRRAVYPKELVQLFRDYCSEDTYIDFQGMIKLIKDCGLAIEDLATICLAHILHWENLQDKIYRDDFLQYLFEQGCCTVNDIKVVLKDLNEKLNTDPTYFTTIYNFSFGLILDDDTRNQSIDMDIAIEYWKLFFLNESIQSVEISNELLSLWFQFLADERKKQVSKDIWQMILEFFRKFKDLESLKESYDENDPWPFVIDEFYEYLQDTGKL